MFTVIAGLLYLIIFSFIYGNINKYLKNINFSLFFIFNISWVLLISLYIMDFSELPNISLETKIFIFLYFFIFNVFYIIFRKLNFCHFGVRFCFSRSIDYKILMIMLILWGLTFTSFIYHIKKTIGLSTYLFSNSSREILHHLAEDGEQANITYYIFGTIYVWGQSYCNYHYKEKKYITLFVVLFSLLLTAAKVNFIVAVLGIFFIHVKYKEIKYKKILFYFPILLIVFFLFIVLFGIFTGKIIEMGGVSAHDINSINDIIKILGGILLYPYHYIVLSLMALDIYITQDILVSHTINFKFHYLLFPFYKLLNLFGFHEVLPPHNLDFVSDGYHITNVYTIFYSILYDFNILGSFFLALFHAFFFSVLDSLLKYSSGLLMYLLYAVLSTAIFFSFVTNKLNDTIVLVVIFQIIFVLFAFYRKIVLFKK